MAKKRGKKTPKDIRTLPANGGEETSEKPKRSHKTASLTKLQKKKKKKKSGKQTLTGDANN